MSKTNNFAKVFQIDEDNQLLLFIDTVDNDNDEAESAIVVRTDYNGITVSTSYSSFKDELDLWEKIEKIDIERAKKIHNDLTQILKG